MQGAQLNLISPPMRDSARANKGGAVTSMIGSGIRIIFTVLLLVAVAANGQVINLGIPGANTAELEAQFSSAL